MHARNINNSSKYLERLNRNQNLPSADKEKLKSKLIELFQQQNFSEINLKILDSKTCCAILDELHADRDLHEILNAAEIKSITQFSKYFCCAGYEERAPAKIIALVDYLEISSNELKNKTSNTTKCFDESRNNKIANIFGLEEHEDISQIELRPKHSVEKKQISVESPKQSASMLKNIAKNKVQEFITEVEQYGADQNTTNQLKEIFANNKQYISNQMLTNMERSLAKYTKLKSIVRKEMTIRLQEDLVKSSYTQEVKEKITMCFERKSDFLDLSNCKLKKIPNLDLFVNHLLDLDLSNNEISEIDEITSYDNLKSLTLSKNPLEKLPDLKHLINLHKLYLNEITKTNNFDFSPIGELHSLMELKLCNNQLTDFNIKFLSPIISQINLDNNPLTTFPADILNGCLHLTKITLPKDNCKNIIEQLRQRIEDNYPEDFQPLITLTSNNIYIKSETLMSSSLQRGGSEMHKISEKYYLNQLMTNTLSNIQAKQKLATLLLRNKIAIKPLQKNLIFFAKLAHRTKAPLLNLLQDNLEYFTKDEQGRAEVLKVLANERLIKPIKLDHIKDLLQTEFTTRMNNLPFSYNLYSAFAEIKKNHLKPKIDSEVNQILTKMFKEYVNELIKTDKSDEADKVIDWLKETNDADLAKIINQYKQNGAFKVEVIKSSLCNKISIQNTAINDDSIVNKIANYLSEIDIQTIKKKYIISTYIDKFFYENHINNSNIWRERTEKINNSYDIFMEYLDFNKAIENYKDKHLSAINQQVKKAEPLFRKFLSATTKYPEIYASYILNVLSYLTPNDIFEIMQICNEHETTPQRLKNALELVSEYIKDNNLLNPAYSNMPLRLFVVTKKTNDRNKLQLLQLSDLFYLHNPDNFKQNDLTPLNKNKDNFWEAGDPLSQVNIKQLTVPNFLLDLVRRCFPTEPNEPIIEQYIDDFIDKLIKFKNFSITVSDRDDLSKAIYSLILKLQDRIVLTPEFKKKMKEVFQEEPVTNEEIDKKNIQLAYQSMTEVDKKNELTPIAYSQALIEKIITHENNTQLPLTDFNELLNNVYNGIIDSGKINRQSSLTRANINYILGVIFLKLSSNDALGYHLRERNSQNEVIVDDNYSSAWFRLFGVLCLAKSLLESDNNWLEDIKDTVKSKMRDIVNGVCSGATASYLFGAYTKETNLKQIYNDVEDILADILPQQQAQNRAHSEYEVDSDFESSIGY